VNSFAWKAGTARDTMLAAYPYPSKLHVPSAFGRMRFAADNGSRSTAARLRPELAAHPLSASRAGAIRERASKPARLRNSPSSAGCVQVGLVRVDVVGPHRVVDHWAASFRSICRAFKQVTRSWRSRSRFCIPRRARTRVFAGERASRGTEEGPSSRCLVLGLGLAQEIFALCIRTSPLAA